MKKEHTVEICLGAGILAVTLAFQLINELAQPDKWLAKTLVYFGAFFFLMAMISAHLKYREDKKKEIYDKRKEQLENEQERLKFIAQLSELRTIRTDISTAVNSLVDELRKDRDERKQSNSDKPKQ